MVTVDRAKRPRICELIGPEIFGYLLRCPKQQVLQVG
jgi:hypothetical protein